MQFRPVEFGNNQAMALGSGLDVKKRVCELGFDELERGNLALDDFAKDTRHVGKGNGIGFEGGCGVWVDLSPTRAVER